MYEIKQLLEKINIIGTKCRNNGFTFLLHNHTLEFQYFQDQYILDYFLKFTDPSIFGVELDCFWMKQAGIDILTYLNSVKDRCKLIHLKDCKAIGDLNNIALGTGNIEVKEIVKQFPDKVFIYEREIDNEEPWNNIIDSYKFFNKCSKI